MDAETAFFCGLMELQYGRNVEKQLKLLAEKIPWARGWPENIKSFWNAEAFMWTHKISPDKRELIKQELKFLDGGKNLDLGCGAYSYIPSVGFDFSEKMLLFNENCSEKIVGDLEERLPFADGSFDSVSAVFVFNYIKNYNLLLAEINRVLKSKGIFFMAIYSGKINDWQRQKEVNSLGREKWRAILKETGFDVDFFEKDNLWFFCCEKKIK